MLTAAGLYKLMVHCTAATHLVERVVQLELDVPGSKRLMFLKANQNGNLFIEDQAIDSWLHWRYYYGMTSGYVGLSFPNLF